MTSDSDLTAPNDTSLRAKASQPVMDLFGTNDPEFAETLLRHCASVSGKSVEIDQKRDPFHAVHIVGELAPKDAVEALLATQMAAVHIAMMRHSNFMARAETIPQLDIQERTFNKLARTFAAQVEALRKHRNGGQQKMTVEHVTVNNGGQAIVGNVSKGGLDKK